MTMQTPSKIVVNAAAMTDIGLTRQENQDAVAMQGWVGLAARLSSPWKGQLEAGQSCFLGVIDGMGGHSGGADAAALAGLGLRQVVDVGAEGRAQALEALSDKLLAAGQAWSTPDMGATIAVLVIETGGVRVFNLGDCRVVRLIDGYLGELTVEDRTSSPLGPLVTQSLGGEPRAFDPHEIELPHLHGKTRYLLSSDGLVIDDTQIANLLASGTPSESASALIKATLGVGAPDNVTVIVVDVWAAEEQQLGR